MLGMALLGVGHQVSPAQAACAYGWELFSADDEFVESFSMCSGASENGAMKSNLDDEAVTVKLNNYNGGMIELKGYGSGLNVSKIIFDLTGENVIDAGDGIALAVAVPVEFTGEGTLKMRAVLPILGDNTYSVNDEGRSATEILKEYRNPNWSEEAYITEVMINPGSSVVTGSEADAADTEKPSTSGADTDEPAEKKNGVLALILHIIAGIYIVGSLVAFGVLLVRHYGKKKPQIPGPEAQ